MADEIPVKDYKKESKTEILMVRPRTALLKNAVVTGSAKEGFTVGATNSYFFPKIMVKRTLKTTEYPSTSGDAVDIVNIVSKAEKARAVKELRQQIKQKIAQTRNEIAALRAERKNFLIDDEELAEARRRFKQAEELSTNAKNAREEFLRSETSKLVKATREAYKGKILKKQPSFTGGRTDFDKYDAENVVESSKAFKTIDREADRLDSVASDADMMVDDLEEAKGRKITVGKGLQGVTYRDHDSMSDERLMPSGNIDVVQARILVLENNVRNLQDIFKGYNDDYLFREYVEKSLSEKDYSARRKASEQERDISEAAQEKERKRVEASLKARTVTLTEGKLRSLYQSIERSPKRRRLGA